MPSSKSLSNRWLVLQHLSGGCIELNNLSTADDTVLMRDLLSSLSDPAHNVNTFHCDNAGTVARFITAVLSITEGHHIVTGSSRMKRRPIAPLVDALVEMGATIDYIEQKGYFPLSIVGKPLQGGRVHIDSSQSSQFVSALMLIAPFLPNGLSITIDHHMVSESYISMTAHVLCQAGIEVQYSANEIHIASGMPMSGTVDIEPDWSSVAYLYNWVLFSGKPLYVAGVGHTSSQGDRVVADIYRQLGVDTTYIYDGIMLQRSDVALSSFRYNFIDCPDLVPALVVACAGLGIVANFDGLNTLPYKETDRIKVLAYELNKLNVQISCSANSLSIIPCIGAMVSDNHISLSSHNDHRMAMAFSAFRFLLPHVDISISNPECVSKSFPNYWHEMKHYCSII